MKHVLHCFTRYFPGTRVNQTVNKCLKIVSSSQIVIFGSIKKPLQNFCLIKKWMMLEIAAKDNFKIITLPNN